VHRLPLRKCDFKTIISKRSGHRFHASKLEMGALCLAVKYCVRKVHWHGLRLFALIDSTALLGAVRKGRSSSENFALEAASSPLCYWPQACSCTLGTCPRPAILPTRQAVALCVFIKVALNGLSPRLASIAAISTSSSVRTGVSNKAL
jgi:hypothetical protein